jgi:hypothetical protein
MNKKLFVIGCVLVLGVGAIVVTASSHGGKDGMGGKCMKSMGEQMCCQNEGGGKCMAMKCGMKHKSMIGTSDGGVVLWMGNSLVKYDSSLNKVSETQVDMEAYCGEKMSAKCCKSDKIACSGCDKYDCKGKCVKR